MSDAPCTCRNNWE